MEQPPDESGDACDLLLQLHGLSIQAGNILGAIRKSHHDIAQYLCIQDKKIDMVARAVVHCQLGGAAHPNARVNLSASGLAFDSDKPLAVGIPLELRLVLFPSHLCIRTAARVVHCEAAETAPSRHRIGVEFTGLSEVAREALVRHTLARQSALLRQKRSRGEA